jgi:hypothetical protein
MNARGRLLAAMVLAAGGFALAGCGHAQSGQAQSGGPGQVPPGPSVSETVGSGPVTTPPPGAVRMLNEKDNGKTITVDSGDVLTVQLSNTYWRFAAPSGPAVRMLGEPTTSSSAPFNPEKSCVPGAGCGTVTANFQSAAPGTAVVSATRSSCGEAMACGGGEGTYTVTVIVH